jgi:putative intracellular protease/amidase
MAQILMILTSHQKMEGRAMPTGAWLGEFTEPYYAFLDEGFEVTLASPKGGQPPLDPRSLLTANVTKANRRFNQDERAQRAFGQTIPLSQVSASDYDAVFYPGGHGPMWDLAYDEDNAKLVIEFFDQGKPIAAVCHGPAALIRAAELRPEILKGKKVTAFSNLEEKASMLIDHIPFRLEDKLKELGALYHAATIPLAEKLEIEPQLITGQNPASAKPAANALIHYLELQKASADH